MNYVFLSHDVDWRKQGPEKQHILARRDRFDPDIIKKLDEINPYYNFPEIMEMEEKYGIRSTFFFRTRYEDGNYQDYEDEIKELEGRGWEIGLHLDPSSVGDFDRIRTEKENLEEMTKEKVLGNRVHYIRFADSLPLMLKKLGFVYDSTVKNRKDGFVEEDAGYHTRDGIIEFPITLMDAYMFMHMKIPEKEVIPTFERTLDQVRKKNEGGIITVIWHDNVLKMKGGRMYQGVLELLHAQDDFEICTGIDLARKIEREEL